MFWYKNYVQWNKVGAVIRINSIFGKSFKFLEVQRTELNDKILTITKNDGKKITADLKSISETDINRLNEIMVKNTIASQVGKGEFHP